VRKRTSRITNSKLPYSLQYDYKKKPNKQTNKKKPIAYIDDNWWIQTLWKTGEGGHI
jgi:hypothetical protein